MSSVAVTIQELFESGQSPSKMCNLLKCRVSRSGVYKILERLKKTSSALLKAKSTPSLKARTPKLIKNTREKIGRNPRRSVQKLAFASGVSYGTMQTVLKNDLNLCTYKITKAQLLSHLSTLDLITLYLATLQNIFPLYMAFRRASLPFSRKLK